MMTQYAKVSFWTVLFGLVTLPCYVWAVSITEKRANIGYKCEVTVDYATAMGYGTTASDSASTAMGYGTTASGWVSTAMGRRTIASGHVSTIIGQGWDHDHNLINDIEGSFMVGYMSSETDTEPEFFVKDNGVGINMTSPSTALHVQKNISGVASLETHVAAIENTSTGSSPDVLMLKMNINNPTAACNFITFGDSSGNIGSIEGNGSGGIYLRTSGGDFAEYLPKANPHELLNPGHIVGLFPDGLKKETLNAQRIMVVTTSPAVLGNHPMKDKEKEYAPVAFLGQVPVKVKGAFSTGDFITPSGQGDGIGIAVSPEAIKPSQYASVVGRTLTTSTAKGVNEATVLVGLPHNELWNSIIRERDARIAKLENRLAALESKGGNSIDIGLLPGAGILIGSLGFLWVDRRRRRS